MGPCPLNNTPPHGSQLEHSPPSLFFVFSISLFLIFNFPTLLPGGHASSGLQYHAAALMMHDPRQITITMTMAVYIYHPLSGTYHLLMKDHRHPKVRDNILLPITICCMHASMPPKQTSNRLRGVLPTRIAGEGRGWER